MNHDPPEDEPMVRTLWLTALALPLVAAPPADAEITQAVLGIRGAEMT
jgi:hypothetical protein